MAGFLSFVPVELPWTTLPRGACDYLTNRTGVKSKLVDIVDIVILGYCDIGIWGY